MLRLCTFGSVGLTDSEGRALDAVLAQPKRLALLVYLAAARPAGVHRRDHLLPLFWPDLDQARARDALNQALRFLRQALGPEAFLKRGADEVGIDPSLLWCDAAAFRAALDAGRPEEALELYRGDFLTGFFVEEAGGFEEWMERERAELRESAAHAARLAAERHEAAGAYTQAVTWGRRALELTPDDERALRRLLRLYDRAGDRAGGLRFYAMFARRLREGFGCEPSPETSVLADQLRAGKPLGEDSGKGRGRRAVAEPGLTRPAEPADELGERYRIIRKLGAGGMATVYLARDVKHDRDVALKILRPEITEGLARERFVREIRIAGRLQHPNIVPLFDSGESDGRLFYVMPHVQGETLRDRLAREGRLVVDDAVHLLREIAGALAYAHEQGVIHRDIKPENVLLIDRRAVLADFGIARAAEAARTPAGRFDETLTQPGTSLGTPAYMAPEQAAGSPEIDHRADLYSLGVLGYEMLAGRPPFVGSSAQEILAQQLTEQPVPMGELRPETPSGLGALLMRCLEKRPAERPASAAAILAEMGSLAPGRSPAPARLRAVLRRVFRVGSNRDLRRPRARRWAARLAILAIGTGLLLGLARYLGWVGGGSGPARALSDRRIAILPFRTSGADPGLAFLRDGLVDLLEFELNGDVGPAAVPAGEALRAWKAAGAGDAPSSGKDAMRVARQLGAGQVAFGALDGTPARFTVTLSVLNTADGRTRLSPIQLSGSRDSLPALVAAISARLLGLNAAAWPLTASDVAGANPDAVRAYLAGMVEYRKGSWIESGTRLFRAFELDSTFTPAAYRFALVHALIAPTTPLGDPPSRDPRFTRLYRLLWAQRQRLSADQRVMLEAVADSLYVLWHQQQLPRLERAVTLLPGSVEAWELLGDAYYHAGALLGREDWAERAKGAFHQALELEATIAVNAPGHLADLAFLEGDARAHARYSRLAGAARGRDRRAYQGAILRGDAAVIRSTRIGYSHAWARGEEEGVDWALHGLTVPQRELDSLLAQMETDAVTDQQRRALLGWVATSAAMGGRPAAAAAALRRYTLADSARYYSTLVDYAWDDSIAADRLAPLARNPTPPFTGAVLEYPLGCNSALSRLRRRDTSGVAVILAGEPPLDGARDVATAFATRYRRGPVAEAAICGQVLRGVLASLTTQDVSQLLRADSLMRGMPLNYADFWNYDLALEFARRGEYRLAIAAVRRHLHDLVPLPRLVIGWREEGRWAAMSGDTGGAIRAYRQYLLWREDPEPALIPQRDSVRAELLALNGGRRRRWFPPW